MNVDERNRSNAWRRLQKVTSALLASICLVALEVAAAQSPPRLSFAVFENAEELSGRIESVLRRAYAQLGIVIEVTRLPLRRTVLESNNGRYDGFLGSVAEMAPELPNLKRSAEPVGVTEYRAYAMAGKARIGWANWETLRTSGLNIGVRNGARVPEHALGAAITERLNAHDALLRMLVSGRIDVAIGTSITTRATLRELAARGEPGIAQVVELDPPLQVQPFYHYLHRRHGHLLERLDAILLQMNRDGSVRMIWEEEQAPTPR